MDEIGSTDKELLKKVPVQSIMLKQLIYRIMNYYLQE